MPEAHARTAGLHLPPGMRTHARAAPRRTHVAGAPSLAAGGRSLPRCRTHPSTRTRTHTRARTKWLEQRANLSTPPHTRDNRVGRWLAQKYPKTLVYVKEDYPTEGPDGAHIPPLPSPSPPSPPPPAPSLAPLALPLRALAPSPPLPHTCPPLPRPLP